MAQQLENQTFDKSEKRTSLVNAKNKYISEATGSISTRKGENVRNFLNLVINQARSVYDGSIEVESDINLLEPDTNDESEQSKIDFFMSVETSFNDEFVDIPFS